jgi:pyruvate,water dikinase
LTAGGLVMEMGGSNSHGAVVAREYGIPAVVGVPEATHKIETGQLITVDGAAGLVSLAAARDAAPSPSAGAVQQAQRGIISSSAQSTSSDARPSR